MKQRWQIKRCRILRSDPIFSRELILLAFGFRLANIQVRPFDVDS